MKIYYLEQKPDLIVKQMCQYKEIDSMHNCDLKLNSIKGLPSKNVHEFIHNRW